jgi:hypothetical protein
VVGKRREPERLALQTNEQKFEEVLQQMKTFLKGAMPIPADLIRGEMGGRGGWREEEDHARHEFCIGGRSVRDLTPSQQIHIPPNDDEKKQFYYQSAMVRESKEGGKRRVRQRDRT